MGFLALLLNVLPWLTTILTLIGGVNAMNAGQTVITYGATPSTASIAATVIPLLMAGLSKLATMLGRQKLDSLVQSGARGLGLSEQSTGYVVDAVNVGRIAVYAKLFTEAATDDERAKILASADVAFTELRARLFPVKAKGE